MQKTDSRRLVASVRQHLPDKAGNGSAVRSPDCRAVGCDALVDLDDVAASHDRFGLPVAEIVDRLLVVPLQQQQVARALRDEKTDRSALAFEHGVGRHGRAVDELLDPCRVEAGSVDRVHRSLIGIRRRARHFRRAHGLSVNRHQVGECPPYFDPDAHVRSRFPTPPQPG